MKPKIQFLLSMVIFGTIGIFVKYVGLASSEIALLRGLIGSLFLAAVLFLMRQGLSWAAVKENVFLLLLSGAALAGNWVFLFQAYKHTTIATATLSYYFAPVFVTILSPIVLKERLSLKNITCIGVSVLGMFLIVGNASDSIAGQNNLLGIAYGLSAAGFYASLMLLNKFIRNLNGMKTTLIQLTIASLFLLPYVFLTEEVGIFQVKGFSILLIIIIGVVHTGIAFFLFFSGMKQLKGQSIAALSYLDPATALLLSIVVLREPVTLVQLAGGALLLGATFISEKN